MQARTAISADYLEANFTFVDYPVVLHVHSVTLDDEGICGCRVDY